MIENQIIRWSPTPPNRVKISFDGSVQSNSTTSGFVIRTNLGKPLVDAAFNAENTAIPIAEALALRNSFICAKEMSHSKIDVEGDSKLVIDTINHVYAPPWRLLSLLHDIKLLENSFESISFKHVFREVNFVANVLVNMGHTADYCGVWIDCVHPKVNLVLSFNSVNVGCFNIVYF